MLPLVMFKSDMDLDFTNTLFSYKREEPTYLPERLRLPSGATRYANSISLLDLEALDFFGPIEKPEISANEVCEWSPEELHYVVRPKTSNELAVEADFLVREQLKTILSKQNELDYLSLSLEAFDVYLHYYGKISSLLESSKLLTELDIPKLELPYYIYEIDARKVYDNLVTEETLSAWKIDFQQYKQLSWLENPITAKRFTMPVEWLLS